MISLKLIHTKYYLSSYPPKHKHNVVENPIFVFHSYCNRLLKLMSTVINTPNGHNAIIYNFEEKTYYQINSGQPLLIAKNDVIKSCCYKIRENYLIIIEL